ncbi:MAG TPA: OsmC family protein [Kribbella sp.]|uniref:OsmC family protein n=1 Tax=Kribbella sp. TaxID=1871183 RepID=UPI002D78C5B1|nr:OsmC family protein [Kribbella sp.]HET6297490.1 OsmC family protein [Kribbella sp.]
MTATVQRPPLNGVDVPTLFATLDAVKGAPEIAQFQFRARNEWISGTHSRSVIQGFFGAGQEDTSRTDPFTYDADHPAVLVGSNQAPTPVEFLLHAIATCLTAGLANIAAARGITLRRVSSTVEGDIDLLGVFGLSDWVRNGYRQIRVHFDIEGDASAEELAALVQQSRNRSAVYDVLINGTDVQIDVSTPAKPS